MTSFFNVDGANKYMILQMASLYMDCRGNAMYNLKNDILVKGLTI